MEQVTKIALLGAIRDHGSLAGALRALALERDTVRRARQMDRDFDRQVRQAIEHARGSGGASEDEDEDAQDDTDAPDTMTIRLAPLTVVRPLPQAVVLQLWRVIEEVRANPQYADNLRVRLMTMQGATEGPLVGLIDAMQDMREG